MIFNISTQHNERYTKLSKFYNNRWKRPFTYLVDKDGLYRLSSLIIGSTRFISTEVSFSSNGGLNRTLCSHVLFVGD